jgi:hypothetical protein
VLLLLSNTSGANGNGGCEGHIMSEPEIVHLRCKAWGQRLGYKLNQLAWQVMLPRAWLGAGVQLLHKGAGTGCCSKADQLIIIIKLPN